MLENVITNINKEKKLEGWLHCLFKLHHKCLTWDHWLYQSALSFDERLKCDTLCNTIADGYAYACSPHLVHINQTHNHIIVWVITVRMYDCHKMHLLWLNDFETLCLVW